MTEPTRTAPMQLHQANIDAMTDACHAADERGLDVRAALEALRDEKDHAPDSLALELDAILADSTIDGSRRDVVETVMMHFELEREQRMRRVVNGR